MISSTQKFAFVLGREQEICLEELKAVLNRFGICFNISRISGNVVFANIVDFSEIDAKKLIEMLGGTIKIFKFTQNSNLKIQSLSEHCARVLLDKAKDIDHKINFGISDYSNKLSPKQVNDLGLSVKKKLKNKLRLRFVALKDFSELSSIVCLKNGLMDEGIEIGMFEDGIGELIALNDPEEWGKRDYGKPKSDKFSGMVPPKLARAMVNITLTSLEAGSKQLVSGNKIPSCQLPVASYRNDFVVVDPFCGTGNILMEAIMVGCDVIGSDISPKAVLDSKTNLEWLQSNFKLRTSNFEIFQLDATSSSLFENWKLQIGNYDHIAIITEPYLGRPKKYKPTYAEAKSEYTRVKELYLSFLKNLSEFRTSNFELRICLIFPLIETSENRRFSLYAESVDEVKKLGYTEIRPTMIYGRDYQVVKREIVLLKVKNQNEKGQKCN